MDEFMGPPSPVAPMEVAKDVAQAAPAVSPEIENTAKALLRSLQAPHEINRRSIVRDVRERREFWNGNHWVYWSEQSQTWKNPPINLRRESDEADQDAPTAYYVNDYLFYGLDCCSVLASNHAGTKFFPGDPNKSEDVEAADGATAYVRYFRKQNRDEVLRVKQAYYLYNDGVFYNYVRPVSDARRFGEVKEPIIQEEPSEMFGAPGVPLPVQAGVTSYPKTEIVLDVYGKLEVRVPSDAESEYELPFIDLSTEVPRASIRAMYPEKAEKIGKSGGLGGELDSYERQARQSATDGMNAASQAGVQNVVTYKRAWVAPWAYYDLDDSKKIQELKTLFPSGFLIVMADDVVCEIREEDLIRRWRLCKGLPATGGNGPSIGGSQLPIQKASNDLLNLNLDTANNSLASVFADREVVDIDAWSSTTLQPGVLYPATARPGQALSGSFFSTPQATVTEQTVRLYEYLTGYASQRATGIAPTVWGGAETGAGQTASGYENMRQQAMRRLGMTWRAMRFCNEESDLLAFELFREFGMDDITFPEEDENGQSSLQEIRVDSLGGEVRVVHETSEEIPISPMEERAFLMSLLQNPNPAIMALFSNPASFPYLKSRLGIKELVFPQEHPRQHQRTEIEELLETQPQIGIGPDGMPIPVATSVMPNPILDDHEAHMAEIRDWWESPDGQRAAESNKMGTANVILHYNAHEQIVKMKAQQAAAEAQAMQGAAPNVVPFQASGGG